MAHDAELRRITRLGEFARRLVLSDENLATGAGCSLRPPYLPRCVIPERGRWTAVSRWSPPSSLARGGAGATRTGCSSSSWGPPNRPCGTWSSSCSTGLRLS
jgi:hypothetical protein